MGGDTELRELRQQRALTLYAIITIKLAKAALFLALALGFYALSDNDLNWEYNYLLHAAHIDGSRKFFIDLAAKIAQIKETDVLWVAAGTLLYGLMSLVEGVGLFLRFTWAGWLAILESALLIPVEVIELGRSFSVTLLAILVLNVIIVAYLVRNRHRLFRHHHD